MLAPYIFFNGTCAEAVKAYEDIFGAKVVMMMRNKDAPTPESKMPGGDDMVMHARLDLNGMTLLASDCPPDMYNKPEGFRVMYEVKNAADGQRIFDALKANGSVELEYQKTFWAH